jgi:nucleoside-diphosphate-sugar epimerase
MNFLLTGAHGFIGTNLSRHLKSHHTLWALDIIQQPSDAYTRYFSWDDIDNLPWNEVDAVIHLAGKAHDTKNKSEAQAYFDINTGLTQKIFDYFLQSNAKQFFFFSSVKAAADTVENEMLTEDIIPCPKGPYGESKIAAEDYINFQLSTFNSQLKNVYILRPCMIHGPGNKGNLNLLYNIVNKGIPWPLGAFENKRSFLNIWNLSYIIEQFITQNPNRGIYHLADDEPVSTNDLIKLIAQSKGKKEKIWNCNKRFIKSIAKIGDVCRLPLNSDRLQKLTETYVVSNQKMKQTLGIEKLPISAVEGFERTLNTLSL